MRNRIGVGVIVVVVLIVLVVVVVLEVEEEDAAGEAEATLAALEVMRSKKFSMPAIDVDEAAVELDLLDHPFYVFKNKGTGQINVVYKRNGGGVGLIEPEE